MPLPANNPNLPLSINLVTGNMVNVTVVNRPGNRLTRKVGHAARVTEAGGTASVPAFEVEVLRREGVIV